MLANLGQFPASVASYDKAISFNQDCVEVWYNRGLSLGDYKQFAEAVASFDKAIAIKPQKDGIVALKHTIAIKIGL